MADAVFDGDRDHVAERTIGDDANLAAGFLDPGQQPV
jgi:hypothetical protein